MDLRPLKFIKYPPWFKICFALWLSSAACLWIDSSSLFTSKASSEAEVLILSVYFSSSSSSSSLQSHCFKLTIFKLWVKFGTEWFFARTEKGRFTLGGISAFTTSLLRDANQVHFDPEPGRQDAPCQMVFKLWGGRETKTHRGSSRLGHRWVWSRYCMLVMDATW